MGLLDMLLGRQRYGDWRDWTTGGIAGPIGQGPNAQTMNNAPVPPFDPMNGGVYPGGAPYGVGVQQPQAPQPQQPGILQNLLNPGNLAQLGMLIGGGKYGGYGVQGYQQAAQQQRENRMKQEQIQNQGTLAQGQLANIQSEMETRKETRKAAKVSEVKDLANTLGISFSDAAEIAGLEVDPQIAARMDERLAEIRKPVFLMMDPEDPSYGEQMPEAVPGKTVEVSPKAAPAIMSGIQGRRKGQFYLYLDPKTNAVRIIDAKDKDRVAALGGQLEGPATYEALTSRAGQFKEPTTGVEQQVMDDWLKKNPGKGASDYAVWKQGIGAQETTGNMPGVIISKPGPDDPNKNKIDAKTGLTPNGVFQSGVAWALTGQMPALGLSGRGPTMGARTSIINTGSALADAAGVDLGTLRAEYKANSTALSKMVPLYQGTSAFVDTATHNLDLALNQSPRVARTGSPLANRYIQWANGQVLTGNPELTKFETYIYTAAREYAKVTSGAAMSVAGLTDTAQKEASKLLNAAQVPEAFSAATVAMKNDMANVVGAQERQIGQISTTIANFLKATTGPNSLAGVAPAETPQPKPATTAPAGKVRVIAPDGKPGFIPAGQLDAALKQGYKKG